MPHVSGRGRGDLYVTVKVAVPTELSKEQKTLVEQLDKTMPSRSFEPTSRSTKDDRPFFNRMRDMFG